MGHNLARQLRMLAFVLATALVVTGCSGTAASVSVQEKPAVSVTLTEECAMPIPKEQGRGEPLEDLVPQYAEEYLADPLLKDSVIAFRRWEWNKVYSGLDTVVRENPDYLDAYRLQAEVYLINQHYEAALSQLDRILERDTTDVHALGVSAIIMHILENAEGEQERLAALEQVNAKAAKAVRSMLEQADTLLYATYTPQPQTDMVPDAITIYGQTPKKNGTPSAGMLSRLERGLEMAEKYPDLLVGAGTVLTIDQVDRAAAAGAKFIVSPGFDPAIVKYCLEKDIPVCPGTQSPSEMIAAMNLGLDHVKFFPAELSGGLKMIKAITAALTSLKVMPTGGISASNVTEYLQNSKIFCAGGSWMVKGDMIKAGQWDEITAKVREAAEIVKSVRG